MAVVTNIGVAYADDNSVARAASNTISQAYDNSIAAAQVGALLATTTSRTVCCNRNTAPYTTSTSSNRNRKYAIWHTIAKNANYSSIKLKFANFVDNSVAETFATLPAQVRKASVYYNGVIYPATFSGLSYGIMAAGGTLETDAISGLDFSMGGSFCEFGTVRLPLLYDGQTANFTVGQVVTGGTSGAQGTIVSDTDAGTSGTLVLVNETGTFIDNEALTDPLGGAALVNLASQTICSAIGTNAWWIEGAITDNNMNLDYTTALPVTTRSVHTPVINGSGDITGSTMVVKGAGYTSGATVYAVQTVRGITYSKNIGFGNLSGGGFNTIAVSSGTPPAGLSAWDSSCQLYMTGGGDFGQTTAVHPASLITGVPDRAVHSLLLIGDSITRGYGSTDANGDDEYNYGFHERALQNICGVINMGIVGINASAILPAGFPKLYDLYMGIATQCRIALGTNDIVGAATETQVEDRLNAIKTTVEGYGTQCAFTDLLPRCTGSWTLNDESTQTPATGFAAGGVADLINAKIANNTIVSSWKKLLVRNLTRGIDPNKWDSTSPQKTSDLVHPYAYDGISYLATNNIVKSSYSELR